MTPIRIRQYVDGTGYTATAAVQGVAGLLWHHGHGATPVQAIDALCRAVQVAPEVAVVEEYR